MLWKDYRTKITLRSHTGYYLFDQLNYTTESELRVFPVSPCWGISWWQLHEKVGCVINCQWSTDTYAGAAQPGLQPGLKGQQTLWAITVQIPPNFPKRAITSHSRIWAKSPRGPLQPGGDRQAGGTSPACSHVLVQKVQSPAGILPALALQLSPQPQAALSHIPSLFQCCHRHRCPPSLSFRPAAPSTKPWGLQTCPALVIICPWLHPALGNPAAHGRLRWLIKHSHRFSSKGMSGLASHYREQRSTCVHSLARTKSHHPDAPSTPDESNPDASLAGPHSAAPGLLSALCNR